MESRFEVTVIDRKTGNIAEYGGIKAQYQTGFGIMCTLVGHDESSGAFICQLLGDEDSGVTLKQIKGLFKAVFHLFGDLAAMTDDETLVQAAVCSAFLHFLVDTQGEKKAAFILHGLSLIPGLSAENED